MDEDRFLILKMLEEGKITAEEAAALLGALEDGSSGSAEAGAGGSEEAGPRAEAKGRRLWGRPSDDISRAMEDMRRHLEKVRLSAIEMGDEISRRFHEAMESEAAVEWRHGGPRPFRRFVRNLGDVFSVPFGKEVHEETFEREVAAAPNGATEVRGLSGDILVEGWDQNLVRVEAKKRVWAGTRDEAQARSADYRIYVDSQGDRVSIGAELVGGAPGWLPARCTVDYKVRVPASHEVKVVLTNGLATVAGITGSVDVRSTNGDVESRHVSGRVRLATTNGDVLLDGAKPARLHCRSVNGDMTVGLEGLGAGENSISTVRGNVRITVPADLVADVSLSTMHGRIDLDAPGSVTSRSPSRLDVVLGAKGTERGGAVPTLDVRTLFGNVLLGTSREG